ncbi:MAG TPA: HD domain-containing phosphohydrolase [Vicinamibacterales bacterium]|nr:HD domain-containing phosphohydrolase [Vicinamibacterales bacterium]
MSDRAREPWPLTGWVKVYFTIVIAAGVGFVALSLWQIQQHPPGYQWYMLAALTLISGSATVSLPSIGISISVSETFVFFSVLLFGPAAGTVMVALDALVMSFWVARRRPEWYRPLFNMAAPAISFWIASHVLFAAGHLEPLLNRPSPANALALPLATCALVYFGLNSSLIAFPTAAQRGLSPFRVWRESSLLLSLNYLFGAALALLLVVYTRDVDLTFIGVIIPLLLVSYLTYKTTVGRIEDANQHLEEVNRLYLSTIETLAMAIDAKDQVTHGHIRRVQVFAVNLAKAIGIREQNLIRAIEAAALLHDMGKLAVPEYILNKPGKLTEAEFERMKLHASVGADILSAIDFPYPVVPIVRHHHENWDGTGYPDGLKGTNIPIGARILSVVDCFDALTSDRPYRPRLRDEEALRILSERRGSMYDPLVVDTFTRVYRLIGPERSNSGVPERALDKIAIARRTSAPQSAEPSFDEIAASADEMLTLFDLSRSLAGQVSIAHIGDVIANHLRRLIPGTLYVFFLVDTRVNELEARHAVGSNSDAIVGLRIPVGQRLSGWVAAHGQTISNSDPVLDLGEAVQMETGELKSCLSVALRTHEDSTVGTLTIYSNREEAFTDDHCRIIEAVAHQIAQTLRSAADFEASARREVLAALPDASQLEGLLPSRRGAETPFTLMFVDILQPKEISSVVGDSMSDEVLQHVVREIRAELRAGDTLCRQTNGDLLAVLNGADKHTASLISQKIRTAVAEHPARLSDGRVLPVSVVIGLASAPYDGRTWIELVAAAHERAHVSGDSTIH